MYGRRRTYAMPHYVDGFQHHGYGKDLRDQGLVWERMKIIRSWKDAQPLTMHTCLG